MRNFCLTAAIVAAAITTMVGAQAATFPTLHAPVVPGFQVVANVQMEVAHSYANLREKASTHSKLLAKLDKGTKLDVLGKVSGGKWTHVKVNGMEGYISTNLLK